MQRPRVQVLLDDVKLTPAVRGALQHIRARLQLTKLAAEIKSPVEEPVDARLVVTTHMRFSGNGKLERILKWFDADPCPMLVLSLTPVGARGRTPLQVDGGAHEVTEPIDGSKNGTSGMQPTHSAPTGGHSYQPTGGRGYEWPDEAIGNRSIRFAADLSQDDLAGQLTAMCGFRRSFEVLRRELEALKKHDEATLETLRCLDEQLREAGAMQRDLFEAPLPALRGAEIHAMYRPASALSGDVYRVTRVDSSHIALALADATGHGPPAAVLSVFIQRLLVASSPRGRRKTADRAADDGGSGVPPWAAELVPPDQVLARLNQEILGLHLHECQFVAALYAVYDERTRVLQWARGGVPYPILIRPGSAPRPIQSDGPLLGVCPDASFETVTLTLEAGDTVIFHTDGLDALVANDAHTPHSGQIHRLPWFKDVGQSSLAEHLKRLEACLASAGKDQRSVDDATVLALRVHGADHEFEPVGAVKLQLANGEGELAVVIPGS